MAFNFRQVLDPTGMTGGSGSAAEASLEASKTQAKYQREALQYLIETDALPREIREGALTHLQSLYGGGPEGSAVQQQMIDQARQSPLYGAMMGGLEQGEEAIMRRQTATGGLRSGDTQAALGKFATNLQNQALVQSYNQQLQGLQGLANQPSIAPAIAQTTAGIGQTLAMGQVGAAQAQQQGMGMGMQTGLGIASLFI